MYKHIHNNSIYLDALSARSKTIGCYRPTDEVKINSIGLAEGFLKPFITAQKRGQIVIGAASGAFASRPEEFKNYLALLAAELNTKTLVLYPDGGAIANNAVMGHYQRAIEMASECAR